MTFPECKVVYCQTIETELHLPYISGFLAFREIDSLVQLLTQLKQEAPHFLPQLLMVDGNGRLHPRKCGIACHLGVISDIPTLEFLVIPREGPLLQINHVKVACKETLFKRGDRLDLVGTSGTVYGTALRATDTAVNPIFVSQGHRISLETAVRVVLAMCHYRIPEPIRCADKQGRCFVQIQKKKQ
ncbi:endonuclease V [Spinellus fusiger]|nr:endonuclease V [Spinellus fusiger]